MTGLLWKVALPFGLLIGAFTLAGNRMNRLGGLIDSVGGEVAQTQVDTVARQLENEVASGGVKITTQSAFVAFVRGAMSAGEKGTRDGSLDRWGGPLALHVVDADRFVVVSCGRDRQCQTRDDLIAWGSFSREGAKGGESVPGWPRERVVQVPDEPGDAPASSGLGDLARATATWLRERPWIAGALGALWLVGFVTDRIAARGQSSSKTVWQDERSGPARSRPRMATPMAVSSSPLPGRAEALELEPMTGGMPARAPAGLPPLAPAPRPELDPLDPDDLLAHPAPAAAAPSYRAPPPLLAADDLPSLPGRADGPLALPHAPTVAAFSPPRPIAPAAPIEPIDLGLPASADGRAGDDPFALSYSPPTPSTAVPAFASPPTDLPPPPDLPDLWPPPDLPELSAPPELPELSAPPELPELASTEERVPRARTPAARAISGEPPPATSGGYSITRGSRLVEGEAPSALREDLRVPTARPRPEPPKRPRKQADAPAQVVERVRPGALATESQRLGTRKQGKDE